METLLIDPPVEHGAEPAEPLVLQSRPKRTSANSGANEIEVHACPGLAETQYAVLRLRRTLMVLTPVLMGLAIISWSLSGDTLWWSWMAGGMLLLYAFLLLLVAEVIEKKTSFCELHIAPEWAEFVSLVNRRGASPSDIRGIVRFVPESDPGRVTALIVDLGFCTVAPLSDHENVLRVLKRFSPAAVVTTERYDDSPD